MATQPRRRQRDEFVDHYGLIMPWKYDFEDLEEYDHKPDEEDWFGIPDPHQAICKYLKQARSSFGFDVDCRAPSWFDPVFIPIDLADAKLKKKRIYDTVIWASNIAISEINKETGLSYEFVEVEKAVLTVSFLHLLTIIVTLADVGVTTIQAIVGEEVHYTFIVEQWRIKPTPTSPPSTPAAAVTSPADAAMASTSPADAATASLASTPAAASSADAAAASLASTPAVTSSANAAAASNDSDVATSTSDAVDAAAAA